MAYLAFALTGGNSSFGLPMNAFDGSVCKEGWLHKRGEFLKNWSLRYFVLMGNGSLIGFKDKPDVKLAVNPVHHFTVTDCQIVPITKSKQYSFVLKAFHLNTIVERTFCVETEKEREEWTRALESASNNIFLSKKYVSMAVAASIENLCDNSFQLSMNSETITLDSFEVLKLLGRGAFGKVVMCKERATKKILAMKIMKKGLLVELENVHHVLTEHKVLKIVRHPFLTVLEYSFQTNDHLCFVMEYVSGGDLLFHLEKEGKFSEHRAKFYAAEVTLALSYMHSLGIIHRDLKLENILLGIDGHIKVADFGLCKENIADGQTTSTFCGTPTYMAPELVELEECGRATDWWTLGVLVYEMVCGKTPFYGSHSEDVYRSIANQTVEYPDYLSHDTVGFIAELLVKNPRNRLGSSPEDANEVMFHPFFNDIVWIDLLKKNVEPPFVPSLQEDTDTQYFDVQCTTKEVSLLRENGIFEVLGQNTQRIKEKFKVTQSLLSCWR